MVAFVKSFQFCVKALPLRVYIHEIEYVFKLESNYLTRSTDV